MPKADAIFGLRSPTESSQELDCARHVIVSNRLATDVTAIAVLLLLTIIVLGKDISVGGLRDGDSSAHAMDGVLIYDWIRAGPSAWPHPYDFALDQYAHYPTLAIGRHYPPGFAIVEAAFFAVFGISAFTSRLCVVFFGCLAAIGAYVFVRHTFQSIGARLPAFACAVILITMPMVAHWGRQEMLELPTLCVMIWAALAILQYLSSPSARRFVLMLSLLLLCILFRQTALSLLAATALTCAIAAWKRTVPRAHAIILMLLMLLAGAAVIATLDPHGQELLRGDPTYAAMTRATALAFYALHLPQQIGLWLAPFILLGLAASMPLRNFNWSQSRKASETNSKTPAFLPPVRAHDSCQGLPAPGYHANSCRPARRADERFMRQKHAALFLICWVLVTYIMLTIPDYKNPRFFFIALFPFAVWAAIGLHRAITFMRFPAVRRIAFALAATGLTISALAQPIEHRPDYGPVVLAHRDRIENHVVLFSGLREGDFVFAVRQHIPWRRSVVMRTSKLLYTCSARPDLDFASNVHSSDEVAEIMSRFAFQTVIAERYDKVGVVEEKLLRDYLANAGTYAKAASYDFNADPKPSFRDVTLDVFEAGERLVRSIEYFDIPLARANRSVRVKIKDDAIDRPNGAQDSPG